MNKDKKAAFWKILKRRLIVSVLLFAAAFVFIHKVVPLVYQPFGSVTISEPQDRQLIRLRKNIGSGPVHGLKINVSGTIDGTAILRIFDAEQPDKVFSERLIGSGSINSKYQYDWYADDCRIEYEPHSTTHGLIKIEYRFNTIGSLQKKKSSK